MSFLGSLLRRGRGGVSFNGDFNLSAGLHGHRLAILILQNILDTNFSIKFIRAFNADLRFLRLTRMHRRDNFLNRSGEGDRWLLGLKFVLRYLVAQGDPFLDKFENARVSVLDSIRPYKRGNSRAGY